MKLMILGCGVFKGFVDGLASDPEGGALRGRRCTLARLPQHRPAVTRPMMAVIFIFPVAQKWLVWCKPTGVVKG